MTGPQHALAVRDRLALAGVDVRACDYDMATHTIFVPDDDAVEAVAWHFGTQVVAKDAADADPLTVVTVGWLTWTVRAAREAVSA